MQEELKTCDVANYHFFYTSRSPFSQFFICPFRDDEGRIYCSAEQYMMYQKAKIFGDHHTASEIAKTQNCGRIKYLGRSVRGYDDTIWAGIREEIVFRGNMHKFGQNPELLRILLETDEKILAEASPSDSIWGIGMSAEIARITNPREWPGANKLGICLMRVRDELRRNPPKRSQPAPQPVLIHRTSFAPHVGMPFGHQSDGSFVPRLPRVKKITQVKYADPADEFETL